MSNAKHILTGMQILLNQEWKSNQAVIIEEGKIKAIIDDKMVSHHLPASVHEWPADHYLTPGLIDLHVHGANGADVMDGTPEALQTISTALTQEGITGFLATTITASAKELSHVLQCIAETTPTLAGAAVLGVHLEGPFISHGKKGAQAEGMTPDISLVKKWQHAAQDRIKIMTLAPELPGAIDIIKKLREDQIIASIGHTEATFEQTLEAIAAGCTQATHLFNAMGAFHQRAPGPTLAALLSDQVCAELITDEYHLHPAVVELALRLKGKDRLLLISDAMRAKYLGDGEYTLGTQTVCVRAGKATLPNGTLAGSTLSLPQAIQNMAQYSHCSLIDAINMCTVNPARILGLTAKKGSIEVGKDADLALFNPQWGAVLTVREGEVVFGA